MRKVLLTLVLALGLALGLAAPAAADPTVAVFVDLSTAPNNYGSTEGIAMDADGNLYASVFATGQILKITPARAVSVFATIPGFDGTNRMVGLTIDGGGNLYAFVAAWFGETPNAVVGVWKITPGGAASQVAGSCPKQMVFPNAGAVDASGNLYVTDSGLGAIYKISPTGSCGLFVAPHPTLQAHANATLNVGSNGIAFTPQGDALIVAVTFPYDQGGDNVLRGKLMRIALTGEGTAGAISVLTTHVTSPDGIAFGPDGTLYVAQVFGQSIAAVSPKGEVALIASGAPLADPASLVVTSNKIYVANLAFAGTPNISEVTLAP